MGEFAIADIATMGEIATADIASYAILVAAGFAAGIINTIAGGGSFLTLPALMQFGGLEAQVANATNRVAVLFSSASAVSTFHKHGHLDSRLALRLTLPTLLGSPVGALLAIALPPKSFEALFGLLFLIMAGVLLAKPKRMIEARKSEDDASPWLMWPIFFAIGVYVGFIQAGMGILLLLAMSFLNTGDLVASNAIKNLIGFLVTLMVTLVFVFSGLIEWLPGFTMACGNVLGGFVGAKLAIKKGNRLVFAFLIVVMVATGVKLVAKSFWV